MRALMPQLSRSKFSALQRLANAVPRVAGAGDRSVFLRGLPGLVLAPGPGHAPPRPVALPRPPPDHRARVRLRRRLHRRCRAGHQEEGGSKNAVFIIQFFTMKDKRSLRHFSGYPPLTSPSTLDTFANART